MSVGADPASLDRLHDIVLPHAVPWWPPAPGWYVALALLGAVATGIAWRRWRRWRADAYRRAALRALADCADLAAVAEVLRRTALVAFPREQIVPLTGRAWLAFLDRSADTGDFEHGPARVLAQAAFMPPATSDPQIEAAVRACARHWIQKHRAGALRC